MKKQFFPFILLIIGVVCLNFRKSSVDKKQTINPVLGDISFISKFGYPPDVNTDEVLRIKTHLEYAEEFLRNKPVSGLSALLQQQRIHLLDLLHQYCLVGIFPRNYDHAGQRKPCFIDKDGRICAVGYLVKQTAGREAAEQINDNHKYEELLAMNDKSLDNWIAESGLTKEECAMIQPTYPGGPYGYGNYIPIAYSISSFVIGATNISTSIINSRQISKGAKNKTAPILGLLFGAGQVTIGALSMPPRIAIDRETNKSKRALSFVNIGVGASSIILSTINLLTNKKPKVEKKTSWGVYSFPAQNNNLGLAFSFTKRF